MRCARDLSVTSTISLCIVPVVSVISLALSLAGSTVLLTGYNAEVAILVLVSVVLIVRMIIAAIDLSRQLNDQMFLFEQGPR